MISEGLCCVLFSNASECEASDTGGGSGIDGHRFPPWRFWLSEERRRDAEGSVRQSGGAGWCHAGKTANTQKHLLHVNTKVKGFT